MYQCGPRRDDEGGTETGRADAHANVIRCGMNGTLLRRLPYRRWLAKIFITL